MIDLSQGEIARLILRSFLCGVAFGVAFEVVRAIKMLCGIEFYGNERRKMPRGLYAAAFAITFITDLAFWVSAGVGVILLTYSGGGFFRVEIVIFMAVGFLVYYFTLGRLLLKLDRFLIGKIKKAAAHFFRLALKPIKLLLGRIILLYHLTIGKIIDKIIEDRKKRKDSAAQVVILPAEEEECGKEGFVYVDGKTGYRREGRVNFGRRCK